MQDPFGLRSARRNQMYGDIDAYVAAGEERKRLEQSLKDRQRAVIAWAAPRRAAAAERKRREETATIREVGKEEQSRPRSNSAYGGRRKSVRRHRRVQRRTRRTRR
jgi:hypothetical protein